MGVTREQLYGEVWAEPMTRVAARYQVSSSFLARVCARLNVPRPPRGYWAQLAVGKAGERPALPVPWPGDERGWSKGDALPKDSRRLPNAPASRHPRARRLLGARPGSHRLVAHVRRYLDSARVSDTGYLRPTKKVLVDISVSKDTLDRALNVASALFLCLEGRGHRVALAARDDGYRRRDLDQRVHARPRPERPSEADWAPARPTIVFIGTVAIGVTLYELSEVVEVQYRDGKYVRVDDVETSRRGKLRSRENWTMRDVPSGRLALRVYSAYWRADWKHEWREAEAGELSGWFEGIAQHLEGEAPVVAELVEKGHREAELEQERREAEYREQRRQEEHRRRSQARKDSRERLLAIVDRWALACRIEDFFEDAEQGAAALPAEEGAAILARIQEARALFGGTDALQHFRRWKSSEGAVRSPRAS